MNSAKIKTQSLLNHLHSHILPRINLYFNQITGYTNVEKQKWVVHEKDSSLSAVKNDLKKAKDNYQSVVDQRQKTQKEIHSLLQRQASWMDMDVLRFTELYRKDLHLDSAESEAKNQFSNASDAFDRAHLEYLNSIRERYIEEQLYSDKIRRASTYWTWGLISSHLLVFVFYQTIVEPRKQMGLKKDISIMLQEAIEPLTTLPLIVEPLEEIKDIQESYSESTQTETTLLFYDYIPSWVYIESKFLQGFIVGASFITLLSIVK